MKLMGFNFTKISAEKLKGSSKGIKLNTNINISDIKEVKNAPFKSKETIISVSFNYLVEYNPDFAKLNFEGTLVLGLDAKESKEILKQWKSKKMPEDFKIPLFNLILRKSNLRAMQLEEEMNIPLHVPLPKLSKDSMNSQKKE
jgi:hypothetical protein